MLWYAMLWYAMVCYHMFNLIWTWTYSNHETALSLELAVIMSSLPSPFKSAATEQRAPMAVLVTTTCSSEGNNSSLLVAFAFATNKIAERQATWKVQSIVAKDDTITF